MALRSLQYLASSSSQLTDNKRIFFSNHTFFQRICRAANAIETLPSIENVSIFCHFNGLSQVISMY